MQTGKWLARFSYTFFILAMLLGWQAYKVTTGRAPEMPAWQLGMILFGAAASFAMGLAGVRARHRHEDWGEDWVGRRKK